MSKLTWTNYFPAYPQALAHGIPFHSCIYPFIITLELNLLMASYLTGVEWLDTQINTAFLSQKYLPYYQQENTET